MKLSKLPDKYKNLNGMKLKEKDGRVVAIGSYDPYCFVNHRHTFRVERDDGWRWNVTADYLLSLANNNKENKNANNS